MSSERSGSTLTRVILGENSRIVAPQEMVLMRYPDYPTFRERHAVAIESLVEFFDRVGQPRDVAAIDAAGCSMSTPDAYRWLFGFLQPDELLLRQDPRVRERRATLRRSLPLKPFYVWLVRHPLGVMESHVRIKFQELHTPDLVGLARRIRDSLVDRVAKSVHGPPVKSEAWPGSVHSAGERASVR